MEVSTIIDFSLLTQTSIIFLIGLSAASALFIYFNKYLKGTFLSFTSAIIVILAGLFEKITNYTMKCSYYYRWFYVISFCIVYSMRAGYFMYYVFTSKVSNNHGFWYYVKYNLLLLGMLSLILLDALSDVFGYFLNIYFNFEIALVTTSLLTVFIFVVKRFLIFKGKFFKTFERESLSLHGDVLKLLMSQLVINLAVLFSNHIYLIFIYGAVYYIYNTYIGLKEAPVFLKYMKYWFRRTYDNTNDICFVLEDAKRSYADILRYSWRQFTNNQNYHITEEDTEFTEFYGKTVEQCMDYINELEAKMAQYSEIAMKAYKRSEGDVYCLYGATTSSLKEYFNGEGQQEIKEYYVNVRDYDDMVAICRNKIFAFRHHRVFNKRTLTSNVFNVLKLSRQIKWNDICDRIDQVHDDLNIIMSIIHSKPWFKEVPKDKQQFVTWSILNDIYKSLGVSDVPYAYTLDTKEFYDDLGFQSTTVISLGSSM